LSVTRDKVLVVDDDALIRETIAVLLRARGYAVTCARDGAEAVQAIERHDSSGLPFRLVVLDIHLPVLDGETLLQYLQRRGGSIPVIAMSADRVALDAAAALGAWTTMPKPLDLDQLLSVVSSTLERHTV
jgi:CheY-like chemotaxis protein